MSFVLVVRHRSSGVALVPTISNTIVASNRRYPYITRPSSILSHVRPRAILCFQCIGGGNPQMGVLWAGASDELGERRQKVDLCGGCDSCRELLPVCYIYSVLLDRELLPMCWAETNSRCVASRATPDCFCCREPLQVCQFSKLGSNWNFQLWAQTLYL